MTLNNNIMVDIVSREEVAEFDVNSKVETIRDSIPLTRCTSKSCSTKKGRRWLANDMRARKRQLLGDVTVVELLSLYEQ